MAYIDNGDGTITTEEGFRIAKPRGMGMPPGMAPPLAINPDITAAAAGLPDMRTASAEDIWKNALKTRTDAGGAPAGIVLPDQDMTSEPKPPRRTEAEIKADDEATRKRDFQMSMVGSKAGNVIAQAMGVPGLPTPAPPKPKPKGEGDGDTVAPEDRVQVGGGPGAGGMPSYGPPRVIDKGGMKPFQETVQKGTKLPDELKDQAEQNILTHRAANEATRLASEEENQQTAAASGEYQKTAEQKLAEEQLRVQRHQQVMQDATSKLDAMAKEYREKPVNQDSYWEEKGAGARILSGLYVAMDEITSLKTGRQGGGVANIIDKQINDWIADKRERREGAIRNQQSLVNNTRANFESESAQNAALRAQAYDAYRAKLGTITANAANEKEKAAALALDADLADKALDWKTKAAQLEADHVTVHEKMVGPTVVGGAPKVAPLERGLVVQDVNGRKYLARDAEQARGLNKKLGLTKIAVDAANKMAEISEKSPGEKLDPNSPAAEEFNFAQEQFVNSMNGLQEQGVTRGDDIERYQKITGGKYGLATAAAARKLASKAQTAYGYHLKSGADTDTELAEDFQQNPKTGALEKVPHYKTFSNGQGGQVPIAFSAVGKHRKKH